MPTKYLKLPRSNKKIGSNQHTHRFGKANIPKTEKNQKSVNKSICSNKIDSFVTSEFRPVRKFQNCQQLKQAFSFPPDSSLSFSKLIGPEDKHNPEQQRVQLEQALPRSKPSGGDKRFLRLSTLHPPPPSHPTTNYQLSG